MANYATLKAAIQQVVKTNGNNEITGALLQQSLLAMVDSLGADYQFVGVAQPSTNPGTPDQNVFYISGSGTFPNFNNTVVPDGQMAVFKYNGSWTVETLTVGKNYDAQLTGVTVTEITPTETTGKYIGIDGVIHTTQGAFAYTARFYVEKGKQIIVRARGYQTAVAMIAKVITENSQYTPLVISTDSTVRDYTYIADESGYYAASFSTSQPRTITIAENTPAALGQRLDADDIILARHETQIASNNDRLLGASASTLTPTENTGQFIGYGGTLAAGATFAYTAPFYAEKGQQILVRARGYLTYVAMISKVVTENSQYTPLVLSKDSTVHDYTYIVQESGYYAASFSTSEPRTIIVSRNTPLALAEMIDKDTTQLADHETRISENESKLVGSFVNLLTLTETANQYIGYRGTIAPANNFAYTQQFYVEKGQQIVVRARGYQTNVAMISKVVVENSLYVPLVLSLDSVVRDYTYIAQESGYYAASFSTSQPRSVTIASNTPAVLSERINELSDRIGLPEMPQDLYFGIPTIGIIGDSLASGAGYDPATQTTHDNIEFAWWKVFERKSGMTYRRFCQGGMSTRSFITNATYGLPAALTVGNECNVYIIGLEVNDRAIGASYLGSVSDIDLSNPDNNGDTYFGNYARIIQKITAFNPGCKFILFTNPRTDGDFNDAIRTIAGMFSNCYLVDLWAKYSEYYTTGGYFDKFKDQTAHYAAMGYQAMAKLLEKAVNECISNNSDDFKNIQYQ